MEESQHKTCTGTRSDGKPCHNRNWSSEENFLCWKHDGRPETRKETNESGSIGPLLQQCERLLTSLAMESEHTSLSDAFKRIRGVISKWKEEENNNDL